MYRIYEYPDQYIYRDSFILQKQCSFFNPQCLGFLKQKAERRGGGANYIENLPLEFGSFNEQLQSE